MTEVTFNTWISAALRPLGVRDDHFYIEAMTDFYHQFVVPRYAVLIGNAISEIVSRPMKADILTPAQADEYRDGALSAASSPENEAGLNPKYTFDTFVVGNNNRFAHAASLAVAESPADAYNPLFIYGGVGLGKTHLMHAIGHYVLSQRPGARIKYLTTERFMNEMVTAINKRTQTEFREKYRNIDVLLIDDIQFLAGKDGTQEEFFHTFNALHNAGKQIVITSDKSPKEISRLEERLRSRFEWGLIADIGRPDLETRVAILQNKAQDELMHLDDGVLQMIAERVTNNIRELEGCLTRLTAYSSLTGRPIDQALAEDALREVFARSEPRHVSCDDVIRTVAEYYSITPEDIISDRRSRNISVPRQIAMYIAREMVNISFEAIGQSFERDHSTITYACKKVAEQISKTAELSGMLADIRKMLSDREG